MTDSRSAMPMPTGTRAVPTLGDITPADLRDHLRRMADWVADYRETIEDRPISPDILPGDIRRALPGAAPEEGESLDVIVRDLDRVILPGIVHWGHPGFLGYFGSTSNGPALLGEIAAAALNVSAMTWKTSPAATELETAVLSWIRDLIGLPEHFTGVVYDTASVAVVHALAAARETAGRQIRERGLAGRPDVAPMRVYASREAHHSLEKAMILLGLGEENAVRIPTDRAFRMDARLLERSMDDDVRAGFRPLAVVATVGTTSSGAIDPVDAVADASARHGAWLHVDAAYGGAIGILPERRPELRGVERADSLVVNPHKWMFVPLDFSALYMRHPDALRAVFSREADYLRGDASASPDAVDYMDYGVQLGRRFRALKAWMVLRAFGRRGIADRIREHCRLARLLAARVAADPSFHVVSPVTMSVVCFRFAPQDMEPGRADEANEKIVERVNAGGDAYLTHTRLRGRTVLRVGIGNIATEERHVERLWELVKQAAREAGSGEEASAAPGV